MGKLAISVYSFVAFLAVFIAEFSLKKWKFSYRPSLFLEDVLYYVSKFFYDLGKLFARLSSFLTFIEIEELVETFCDLISPIIGLILSPVKFIFGYCRVAFDYMYKRPLLIFIGSGIIIAIVIAILIVLARKYGLVEKVRNQWRKRFPKKPIAVEKVPEDTQSER